MNHDEMADEAVGLLGSLLKKSWPLLLLVVTINVAFIAGIVLLIRWAFFS